MRFPLALLVAVSALGLAACGDRDATAPAPAASDPPFTIVNVSSASGIDFELRSGTRSQRYIVEVKSTGVGLLDYDGDGILDVVLTAGSTLERERAGEPGFGTRLYRGRGDLTFEDVTEAAGIPATAWACAPICADYDGDGDTDLYVTCYGRNVLLRNEGGTFRDVTDEAGVGDGGWGTSAVFHDLDGDGDLDLYVCNYLDFDRDRPPEHGADGLECRWKEFTVVCGPRGLPPQSDRCYVNEGDGRFRDVTEAWGVGGLPPSYGLGVVAGDFDRDGAAELYVANDGMANFWLDWTGDRLEENGYFLGVSLSEDGAPQAGMGLDVADLNGDGRDDFVCTNFSGEVNNLYLSEKGGAYREASTTTGIANGGLDSLGWGVGLRDFDMDGRLDVFIANGHVYPAAARPGTSTDYPQYNLLYLQREPGRFSLASREDVPALAVKKVSRGAAFGDLDNDGDPDIVVANLNDRCTVLETRVNREATGRHFLGLELRGTGAARDAVGARITVRCGDTTLSGEVRRQASFQASNDPRVLFGLGESSTVDSVEVHWPDGRRESFSPPVDAYTTLVQGDGR